jgi:hypothetical protein
MPHVKDELATFKQIEYIKMMCKDMGEECDHEFAWMTKIEASMIIKSLLEKLEIVEKD